MTTTIDIRGETGPVSVSSVTGGFRVDAPSLDTLFISNSQATQLATGLGAPPPPPPLPKTLVMIGDSIPLGERPGVTPPETFVQQVGAARGFTTIINAGIAQNRTDQMLARFDADVLAHNPGHIGIMMSANDFYHSATALWTPTPLFQSESNMFAMLEKAHVAGVPVTLMSHNWIRDAAYLAVYQSRRDMLARLSAHPAVVAFVDVFLDWSYKYVFAGSAPFPNAFDTLFMMDEYDPPHVRQLHPSVLGQAAIATLALSNPAAFRLPI